jgi:N-acetylmuramic acid 6-phosphate etherase
MNRRTSRKALESHSFSIKASLQMHNLSLLPTEARNPVTESLDGLSTLGLVGAIHEADGEAVGAVEKELPRIAQAIDSIVARLEAGGRLFYLGAGTSGRLGVLDASECPPTYNTSPELVQGVIAGGDIALRRSVERAEDAEAQGRRDLEQHGFSGKDVLVGIAASGRTPYVLGGVRYARVLGALTIGLSCVPGSLLAEAAELGITPATGPEVVTGSTRMKAGTATKLVLNMLSTGTMVRLGYVYGNLMVNVQPTNAKLRDRAGRIVATVTGLSHEDSVALLERAGSVKAAIVMQKLGVHREEAERRLKTVRGRLRQALDASSASRA